MGGNGLLLRKSSNIIPHHFFLIVVHKKFMLEHLCHRFDCENTVRTFFGFISAYRCFGQRIHSIR